MNKKMRKCLLGIAVLLVCSGGLSGCAGGKEQPNKPVATQTIELNVSAAVSLKDALLEIQTNYQAKHPEVKLLYNLGASGSLQKQIEQGAPADIFISAAAQQMDGLADKQLVNKTTRKNLVRNQLVIVVPKASTLVIDDFAGFKQSEINKIAVGEPKVVPAGQYAQQVLQKLNLLGAVQDKLVFAKDVRTVLAYTETGNVEAGIVYKTDAASSDKVKVAAVAPADSHAPIVYPAAVLAGAKQAAAAETFLSYLFSPEAQTVFEKYGFAKGE